MHPALSVVFFTTLSGAGLGLLCLLGVMQWRAPLPLSREYALIPLMAGLLLLATGLGSSFLHLGQPRRAWRAFSQWRSSWLSREAVAAAATGVAGLTLAAMIWRSAFGAAFAAASAALAVTAAATLFATARIYDTLRTIPAWCSRLTLPTFLLAGVLSGALWLWMLLTLAMWPLPRCAAYAMAVGMVLLIGVKLTYWRQIDRGSDLPSTGDAIGLASIGAVRPLEAPHTEANYLLREMGFVLARRHSRRLRFICVVGLSTAALAICLGGILWQATAGASSAIGVIAAMLGIFVERWLFFAEARHVMTAYYRVT